jgi:hypothetical protein
LATPSGHEANRRSFWCVNPACGRKPSSTPDHCPYCGGGTVSVGYNHVPEPQLLFLRHAVLNNQAGAVITVPADMLWWKLPCGCKLNGGNRNLQRGQDEVLYHSNCSGNGVIDPAMLC